MSDNRPSCYYETNETTGDTQLVIRTSAIGSSCLFELIASGQGYEPSETPAFLQRAFDAGNELEPVIIGMLEDEGYIVLGKQEEGELVVEDGLIIRFHPDGYINHSNPEHPDHPTRILEVKALSDVLWQKAARGSVGDTIDEYNWQLSVMMHKDNLPAMWVCYNKGNSDGSECEDKGKLLFERVETPPIKLFDIEERARRVKHEIESEDVLVSGRPCDDPTHFPCRFLHLRMEDEGGQEVAIDQAILTIEDAELAEEVDRLTKEYVYCKGQIDELKPKQDAARDRLIEIAAGHKKVVTDHWVVPVVNGANSSIAWHEVPPELKAQIDEYKRKTTYKYIRGAKRLD